MRPAFLRGGRRLGRGLVVVLMATPALAGDVPLVPVSDPLDRTDAAAHDGFATAMAAVGDGIFLACRGADGAVSNAGAVLWYRDLGQGLVQIQKLTPSDPDLRHEYGHAIAGAGAVAAVGVPLATSGGAVSVLTQSGGSWRQASVLRAGRDDITDTDAFGDAVAVRADGVIAIGAPGATVNGQIAAGVVEIFEPAGGDWVSVATLQASVPVGNDRFGASVAFVGNDLVVGVPFDDAAGTDAGAIERFRELPVLGWSRVQTVTPSNRESLGYFGRRLAADGDRLVVGAPRLDAAGPDSGAAIVLRLESGSLVEEAAILPPSPRAYDDFGGAVAIKDDLVVVGAPADPRVGLFQGAAYAFDLSSGTPRPILCMATFGSGYAFLGTAVGISGRWVLGGAPLDSAEGEFSGAAYAVDVQTDCDASGVPDAVELWSEPGSDADGNGVLDRCECPADLVADGVVNGVDLGLYLVYAGGPCGDGTSNPNCIGDFNGDGEVRGGDLGVLLAAWGPCP
jgi:hypothetical protein